MIPLFKEKPAEFDQHLIFPSHIFDLLNDDHDCFVYSEIFKGLDTSKIESQLSPMGQHAYHPKLIVSILIYSYSHGVFSSRQIEQRCNEDLSFISIAQLGCPNYRVLSDFRKDHHKFFKDCFKQTVKMAIELTEEMDTLIKIAAKSDQEEDQAYKEKTGYELPEDLKHKESRLEK